MQRELGLPMCLGLTLLEVWLTVMLPNPILGLLITVSSALSLGCGGP